MTESSSSNQPRIIGTGTVTISDSGVHIEGFEFVVGDGITDYQAVKLAGEWAIDKLRERIRAAEEKRYSMTATAYDVLE